MKYSEKSNQSTQARDEGEEVQAAHFPFLSRLKATNSISLPL
jgi:hypothetical protein